MPTLLRSCSVSAQLRPPGKLGIVLMKMMTNVSCQKPTWRRKVTNCEARLPYFGAAVGTTAGKKSNRDRGTAGVSRTEHLMGLHGACPPMWPGPDAFPTRSLDWAWESTLQAGEPGDRPPTPVLSTAPSLKLVQPWGTVAKTFSVPARGYERCALGPTATCGQAVSSRAICDQVVELT